jgi:hypothetical protein
MKTSPKTPEVRVMRRAERNLKPANCVPKSSN